MNDMNTMRTSIRSRTLIKAASDSDTLNNFEFRTPNEILKVLRVMQEANLKTRVRLRTKIEASNDQDDPDGNSMFKVIKIGDANIVPSGGNKKVPSKGFSEGRRVENFNRPKPGSLKKMAAHFESFQDYMSKLELLESLIVRAKILFKGHKKERTLNSDLEQHRKELEQQTATSMQALQVLAEKHVPEEAEQTFNKVLRPVLKQLAHKFSKRSDDLMVNTFMLGSKIYTQFTMSTLLVGLKNDLGQVYPKFYIILTCLVDNGGYVTYFVTTSYKREIPSSKGPNDHSRGMAFSTPDMGRRLLETHLKVDEALEVTVPGDPPIDSGKLLHVGSKIDQLIRSKSFDEDEKVLKLNLIPGLEVSQVQKMEQEILKDIGGLLYDKDVIHRFKHSKVKTGKAWQLQFWFMPPAPRSGKKYRDTVGTLRALKSILGLDDAEIKGISRVLQSRVDES